MEVGFAAKEPMKEHQGCALSLPIKDIISHVDWVETAGGTGAQKTYIIIGRPTVKPNINDNITL